jgi:hypothetical protein
MELLFQVFKKFSQTNQFFENCFVSMKDLIRNETNGKENKITLYQDFNRKSKEISRAFVRMNWKFILNRKLL